jgi:hypothetical protein
MRNPAEDAKSATQDPCKITNIVPDSSFNPTKDITLEGKAVKLVPLQREHAPLLWRR